MFEKNGQSMEPVVIYFLGILAVLIIFIILFRKQVRLRLISIKHGKYSYKYVRQFKKYVNKSPFPYCFKDDIMPYLRLGNAKKDNVDHYPSEMILLFEGIPYYSSLQEIIEKYGKPDCFNAFNIKNQELRAYGYNKSILGIPVKAVFFFIFESFVMGEYLIDDLTEGNIQSVSKSLMDKCGVIPRNDAMHYYIDGNETSVYFYENGFSAMIRYMNQANVTLHELIK